MARNPFTVESVIAALGTLEVATATSIASAVLGTNASDDDRRAVNQVLLAEPNRFEQQPDKRWRLVRVSSPSSLDERPGSGPDLDVRSALVEALERDLLGPREADEILDERPSVHYLVGILRPGESQVEPDAEEELGTETESTEPSAEDAEAAGDGAATEKDDAGTVDEPPPSTEALNQSSIGLSFAVAVDVSRIQCRVRFGTYSEDGSQWRRADHMYDAEVELDRAHTRLELPEQAQLLVSSRNLAGSRTVTVFLVNRHPKTEGRPDDADCLFQPQVLITTPENALGIVARPNAGTGRDPDSESNRLLYRMAPEFAVGHGCSVAWDGDPQGTNGVWTTLLPRHETPRTSPTLASVADIAMDALAQAPTGGQAKNQLKPIVDQYEDWISTLRRKIDDLPAEMRPTARVHIDLCADAAKRMSAGIALLESDPDSLRAFKLASQAMSTQRIHALQSLSFRRSGIRPTRRELPPPTWRPFQLAFILMNLVGVAQPDHPERRIVDLLWFPTGGGKTEAYLGLAAFAIFLRRIRAPKSPNRQAHSGAGVSVLMRYTLRLLTVQQFQRAATLVCAMELLRRANPRALGADPILIGLWVGQKTSPNNYEDAKKRLAELRDDRPIPDSNPVHLSSCPWCGTAIDLDHYFAVDELNRVLVHCPNHACDFYADSPDQESAIPATVVDDDIYARCPSIVIGTVDKFARLPWNPATMTMFGRVGHFCARHGFVRAGQPHPRHNKIANWGPTVPAEIEPLPPPDLIVQDELHLITGPLGTLTGIYEAAIAFLAGAKNGGLTGGPKIVASTATIRRADDQVRALFARETRRFPPAGLDVSDSFFAHSVATDEQPGRLYVGVYGPGRSGKTVLVRVVARLLQEAGRLSQAAGALEADPYWTLVGYFNSLRELGGAARLTDDDIPARIALIAKRSESAPRPLPNRQELTSRIPPERVPEILAELEQTNVSGKAIDTLLATNMIQVGVDIDRLGLMVVHGQPKTSAEYIQATSRVGRVAPGLVVTILNWTRPRDISHYERFVAYHSALYQHVEGSSLTPMSARSRDRAMAGVMVAMVRLRRDGWGENQDAGRFIGADPVVREAQDFVVARAGVLDAEEIGETKADLLRLEDVWERLATSGVGLRYANPFRAKVTHKILLHSAEESDASQEGFRVLTSLRDVEAESDLRLVTRRVD